MRVDFYQLAEGSGAESVIVALAGKLLGEEGRLLVVSSHDADLARLDRLLWQEGPPASFLPHGVAGTVEDRHQPVLLSTSLDAPNGARHLLIADGEWREAALHFDRAFFLFQPEQVEAARFAWKTLSGRDGVERHYWAREDGRWEKKG